MFTSNRVGRLPFVALWILSAVTSLFVRYKPAISDNVKRNTTTPAEDRYWWHAESGVTGPESAYYPTEISGSVRVWNRPTCTHFRCHTHKAFIYEIVRNGRMHLHWAVQLLKHTASRCTMCAADDATRHCILLHRRILPLSAVTHRDGAKHCYRDLALVCVCVVLSVCLFVCVSICEC